jgi:hypothetical protein
MSNKFALSFGLLLAAGLSTPSVAQAYECSFQGFSEEMAAFTAQYPVDSNWGTRATYQYAYFLGTEGINILQKYQSCLSSDDFAANYAALKGSRDAGLSGCQQTSTDPGSCTPTYPQ